MSGHADTIRAAVDAERARLVPGTVEKYPEAKVSVRILDAEALLAENQRLKDEAKDMVLAAAYEYGCYFDFLDEGDT